MDVFRIVDAMRHIPG
jgi:hypothetical protein